MRVFLLLFVAATAMALSHDQPIAQVASFEESQTLPATLSYGALDAPTQPSVKEGDITVKLRSLRGKGRGRGRGRRGSHRRHLTAIQTDEIRELSIVGGGFMGGVKSLGRKVHSTAGNIGRATGRLAGKVSSAAGRAGHAVTRASGGIGRATGSFGRVAGKISRAGGRIE
ncbi:unnamed protein product, partial [Aphanomyces euteiches]